MPDRIAQLMMANNDGRPIPAAAVLGFPSPAAANAWMLANPRRAQVAVHFSVSADARTVGYGLQVNASSKAYRGITEDPVFRTMLPAQLLVEREAARLLSGANFSDWSLGFERFA